LATVIGVGEEPPDDPEAWSHEQWMAWLNATDPPGTADAPSGLRIPKDRPAGIRLMGAAMLGMHDAIYGPKDDPKIVVVADAHGQDGDPEAIELHLVPEHPEGSWAVIRAHGKRAPESGRGPNVKPS
jgi:hypothetical protein